MSEFEGLVAIVTGGGSGIGLATAELLSARGARVAALDLEPVAARAPLLAVLADVTDQASLDRAIAAVVREFGRLDILINNAGIGAAGTIEENSPEEWHRVFDVNVVGIARATRAALPHLRASPAAAIVNTCSIAATAGLPNRAVYSASKGAVLSLTLAMAADHIGENIRVNCVNPGTADTPWVQRLLRAAPDPAEERRQLAARQPTGRLVTANEIAAAIAYLASPLASATTGTSLAVDGGMHGLRLRKSKSVQYIALHTRLRAGKESEYERVHAVIPPELDALLRSHGISSWRIYRNGRDLFHAVECEDYAAFLAAVEHDSVNVAWQQHMGELLEVVHDYSDPAGNTLPLVWALP